MNGKLEDSLLEVLTASLIHIILILIFFREEPESMAQANAKATVQDLLMFRQAVTSMNESRPFGRSFGLVSCLDS